MMTWHYVAAGIIIATLVGTGWFLRQLFRGMRGMREADRRHEERPPKKQKKQ